MNEKENEKNPEGAGIAGSVNTGADDKLNPSVGTTPSGSNTGATTGKKSEKVEVDKALLEEILSSVQGLKDKEEKWEKERQMLMAVADKGRLAQYKMRNPEGELVKEANVWRWNGKYVIRTEMIKDRVVAYPNLGKYEAEQTLKIIFSDGTEDLSEYKAFADTKELVKAEVTKFTKEKGVETWTMMLEDGEELDIDPRFLN